MEIEVSMFVKSGNRYSEIIHNTFGEDEFNQFLEWWIEQNYNDMTLDSFSIDSIKP